MNIESRAVGSWQKPRDIMLTTRRNLARSVLLCTHEKLADDPDVTTFRAPLLRQDQLALNILRDNPEDIERRLSIGRLVTIELDETVQPPEIIVTLGEHRQANS